MNSRSAAKWGNQVLDSVALASATIGVAIVFAALVVGYFVVLRDWAASVAATREVATRASMHAQSELQLLESLSPSDLVSADEVDTLQSEVTRESPLVSGGKRVF